MAKYNKDLLDLLVRDMHVEGRSDLEIMTDLDLNEQELQSSLLRTEEPKEKE
eukprot:NODE_1796_length_1065_cov_31.307087_g1465_i0.p5 GENE.NODE_1796_length_1065_cov_31.307087_g1465_i0~~NODE_1796_length_1065_cov_31.307087_g1465_i0.p5  ORF type:complete len:52 (-),score=32.92 NODE_1796_length_1065_cov_31.307087_g1465_i0:26-181(-)